MPSIAKTIGLILVVINSASPAAQTARTNNAPPDRRGSPSIGYSYPFGQSGGFGATPMRAATPEGPHAAPFPNATGAGPAPHQRAYRVVPALYETPLSSGKRPPDAGRPPEPSAGTIASVPLSPPARQSLIPLPPPGRSNLTQRSPNDGLPSMVTVAGSLALVLGVFFLVAWGIRRASPAGGTALPDQVFQVLGRAPMANRQQVHLLRCGNKLILVSVTTAGTETLTEITDPVEVDRLAGLCRQAHPNSATAAFRQVFGQLASGHLRTGLLGASGREEVRPAVARPFGTAFSRSADGRPTAPDGLEETDV